MSCAFASSIGEYVLGRVGPALRALVEEHLPECESCRALVADLRRETVDSGATVMAQTPSGPGGSTAREAPSDLRAGQALGRYVVRRRIGAGGMGVVYEAHDPLLDRPIALKVLRSDAWADSEEMRLRFVREAQALARVAHVNVVPVHDVGRVADRVFIAMDFVDGTTADEWLSAERRGWRDVLGLYLRAGAGLAAAHDGGLVHRDFKPANVLVGRDGRVCVTDFGLVRILAEAAPPIAPPPVDAPAAATALTDHGTIMGSPGYMAPEQMVGGEVGLASDVFAFAVSLYEGLYGERPFEGESLSAICAAIQRGAIPPPREQHTVPPSLRAVIVRALAVRPEDRPTMRALLDELERERDQHTVARAEKILEEAGVLARMAGGDAGFVKVAARLLRDFVEEAATQHRREPSPTPPPGTMATVGDALEERLHAVDDIPPDAPHLGEVEMSGSHAQALLGKLGYRTLASHFMLREGIGVLMPDGSTGFDPKSWYPALPFLRAAHRMSSEMGPRATFHVGLFTRERGERPRAAVDPHEALRQLDVTYHRNFRRRGVVYQDDSGAARPGIGRYLVEAHGPTSASVAATGPWPCSFDRGLVSGVILRIAPEAIVEHAVAAGDPCRAHGGTRCVYRLRWGETAGAARDRRLRPVAGVEEMIADPVGRVLRGETFTFWYLDPHLEGAIFRGAPRADELRSLIHLWDVLKNEEVVHGTIIDLRDVVEIPKETFAVMTELLRSKRDEYGRRLRLAVIRPAAMPGALVTGALQMSNPLHPLEFFDGEAAALAWLGHDDPALVAELRALRVGADQTTVG